MDALIDAVNVCLDNLTPSETQTLVTQECSGTLAKLLRDTIEIIEADGWRIVAQRGSHRQFKRLVKPGRVTTAGALSDELAPGTLNSIPKQPRLKRAS
jgi:predicted RNA binding protein YcfA (HicA-like mRNA interferase family)